MQVEAQEIHGVKFLSRHMGYLPARELQAQAVELCRALDRGVVALTSIDSGKPALAMAISPDLAERLDLAPLLQTGTEALDQAHADNAADALAAVGEALAAMLDATMRGEAEAIA